MFSSDLKDGKISCKITEHPGEASKMYK